MNFLHYLSMPSKFRFVRKEFGGREFNLLDVGCGFHAPSKTVSYFPNCNYFGVDRDIVELDSGDMEAMKEFYKVDLDTGDLSVIPDNAFDVIVVSHVIEHLHHGIDVLMLLATKLRKGGCLYIEYPGARSLAMPNAKRGFLNFSDDPTHVRVYSLPEVANALLDAGLFIIRAGTRRDPFRLLFTPLFLLRGALRGDFWGGGIWDAAGNCEYALARSIE